MPNDKIEIPTALYERELGAAAIAIYGYIVHTGVMDVEKIATVMQTTPRAAQLAIDRLIRNGFTPVHRDLHGDIQNANSTPEPTYLVSDPVFPSSATATKETKNKPKSRKVKTESLFPEDQPQPPIWSAIITALKESYERLANVKWDPTPKFFGYLKRAVDQRKSWTADEWKRCISNREASDDINPGASPEAILSGGPGFPPLSEYIACPLNQWHKPKAKRDEHEREQNTRTTRNRTAFHEFAQSVAGTEEKN